MIDRISFEKGTQIWTIAENITGKQLSMTQQDARILAGTIADEMGKVLVNRHEWERLKELERGLQQL